ncbi:MAG: hypothetical protein IMX05_08740 [Hydrogenibacillus schlegelii]|nr:hypothetical protein [Hydrogenibacillus schlegelii]
MEKTGVLTVYDGDWGRPGGVQVRTIRLAAPDHVHFVETDDALYVGFLRQGFVQAIDKAIGAEFARLSGCPALHGVAYDPDTGRTFWGCKNDVMVVGTRGPEKGKHVGRIQIAEGAGMRPVRARKKESASAASRFPTGRRFGSPPLPPEQTASSGCSTVEADGPFGRSRSPRRSPKIWMKMRDGRDAGHSTLGWDGSLGEPAP